MDKITREQRSANMSAIRSKDTRQELRLRSALWRAGLRGYRLHSKNLPGKPDVTYSRYRVAIFVDGCFSHGCPDCYRSPSSNTAYWSEKLARNVERDRRVTRALEADGWVVLRFWEHETKRSLDDCVELVRAVLLQRGCHGSPEDTP